MRAVVGFALLLVLAASSGQPVSESGKPAGAQRPDALRVVQRDEAYELSVPVSRLVMSIPRGQLVPRSTSVGGATNSPRYFYFVDRAFNLSGWFEPAQKFSTVRKLWDEETKAWSRNGLPAPMEVSFRKVEGWEVVFYDSPSPVGNNSHLRAHWVQAGTWIELHLSMTADRPIAQNREFLETFLKLILVRERKP